MSYEDSLRTQQSCKHILVLDMTVYHIGIYITIVQYFIKWNLIYSIQILSVNSLYFATIILMICFNWWSIYELLLLLYSIACDFLDGLAVLSDFTT